jgi:hypothetical protein
MATISEVKAGLDDIATAIRTERQAVINADQRKVDAKSNLELLATVHAATIAEINGYSGNDPFEALSKDELAKLIAEFQALIGTL